MMWGDDRFLDLRESSERVREVWIRRLRRSRVLLTVGALGCAISGLWQLVRNEPSGALALFMSLLMWTNLVDVTMQIRLLRLMDLVRRDATHTA